MKRLLMFCLALAMALSLAACGMSDSSGGSSSSGSTPPSASMPEEKPAPPRPVKTKTGLGAVISLADSKAATPEQPGRSMTEITFCAATFDEEGRILGVVFDTAEAGVEFDKLGALTTDITTEVKTKRQLGDSYGMKEASGIKKEWYEQVDALQEWMIGKKAEEVLGMKTSLREDEVQIADEEELKSSVTIGVTDFLKALKQAWEEAR